MNTERPLTDGDGDAEATLDERILMEAASGDLTEAAALTSLFFHLVMEQFEQMRAALDIGDRSQLGRIAHKAAGGAATCGLLALASALREVETATIHEARPDVSLERVDRELARAREAVRSFLGEGGT